MEGAKTVGAMADGGAIEGVGAGGEFRYYGLVAAGVQLGGMGEGVEVGEGVQVGSMVEVGARVRLGMGVQLGTGVQVAVGVNVSVGVGVIVRVGVGVPLEVTVGGLPVTEKRAVIL